MDFKSFFQRLDESSIDDVQIWLDESKMIFDAVIKARREGKASVTIPAITARTLMCLIPAIKNIEAKDDGAFVTEYTIHF